MKSTPRRRVVLALLSLALAAAPAGAHNQPFSIFDLNLVPGEIRARLTLDRLDAARELGFDTVDSLADSAMLLRRGPALLARLEPKLPLRADGVAPRAELTGVQLVPERTAVMLRFRYPVANVPGEITVSGPLDPTDPAYETFVNVYEDGQLRIQAVLDHGQHEARHFTGSRQGALAVVRTFIAAGVHHIFIGPDHILFVVGLLLLGGGLRRMLKIVTAFTLAHSVTLALAALQWVNIPARVIEPMIALSIVFIGVDNLRHKRGAPDRRVWIAFGFGLVHGFGFANVLREFGLPGAALGWSLFAFNAGVEVGQACIVGAVTPLLALVRVRAPQAAPRVVVVGSAVVALAGAYWLVERVLGLG